MELFQINRFTYMKNLNITMMANISNKSLHLVLYYLLFVLFVLNLVLEYCNNIVSMLYFSIQIIA